MRYLLPAILALAMVSCSTNPGAVTVAAKPLKTEPVIARIASRKTTIVVRAGVTEPTYSLETAGGEVLVKDTTLAELARTNPEMCDRVQKMQAQMLWAGE